MFISDDYWSDSTWCCWRGQKPSATWALIPCRRHRVRASSASEIWAGRCGNESTEAQRKRATCLWWAKHRALQGVNKKTDNISPGSSSLCFSASSHRFTLLNTWMKAKQKAVFIVMKQTLPIQLAASSHPGMVSQLITSINTKKWNSSCGWTCSYILVYWKLSALLLFFSISHCCNNPHPCWALIAALANYISWDILSYSESDPQILNWSKWMQLHWY